jgi:FkbM family methyltransferase
MNLPDVSQFIQRFTGDVLKGQIIKPQLQCNVEFHGTEYGGWYIKKNSINENSIIYSFGVGEDISFDLSIIHKYGANIYAFDPTPKSINWVSKQNVSEKFHFLDYGISDIDGVVTFFAPDNSSYVSYTTIPGVYKSTPSEFHVKKLTTIIHELGHNRIDVLKMDIEGTEYKVIDDLVRTKIKPTQILIEFHHRFEGIGFKATLEAIRKLNEYGYKIFKVSNRNEEISFIRSDEV